MPNVFISSETESQWQTILGRPQLIECMGICILSQRLELNKGVPTLFAYCEKLIWIFFFKFNQDTCPWMAFVWIFLWIFLFFERGVSGANHL